MKREDVSKIFGGATEEQISAILDINSRDIGSAKAKSDSLTEQITALNDQLKARDTRHVVYQLRRTADGEPYAADRGLAAR